MKVVPTLILGFIAMALPSAEALAQFVKGNEAVTATSSGPKAETPPIPASVGKVCAAAAKCHAGAWHMVETAAGVAGMHRTLRTAHDVPPFDIRSAEDSSSVDREDQVGLALVPVPGSG